MARFLYQARDAKGELATGMVNASNMDEASHQLRSEGKFIVKISPMNEDTPEMRASTLKAHARRCSRKQVIFFAHQMAVMIETGVPLTDALQCCTDQTMDPHFRAVLEDVTQTVHAGGQFSTALRKFPRVFPPVMTSLLRASEMSGTMSGMLDRISQYLSKEQQTIKQAKGAMMYPMFMVVMAVGVTVFLLTFVLPRFAGIYATRNAALPAPTQLLMTMSSILVNYWYFWVGGLIATVSGIWGALLTKQGRRGLDWIKLNMPLIGRLYQQLYITRSCRTMGTMINAGVSMLDMVAIIKHVTDNAYFQDLWEDVDDKLRQGSQLSDSLFNSPLIPRSIGQMVYSGERSGQLGKVMNRIAEFTEAEFDQTVKTVTSMIEPIMVAVMGTIIGFVAISLLLPIFSIGKVVAGG